MFNDSDSFYYSPDGGDLTNSIQKQQKTAAGKLDTDPLWQRADDTFFWNKHMLQELINFPVNNNYYFYFFYFLFC